MHQCLKITMDINPWEKRRIWLGYGERTMEKHMPHNNDAADICLFLEGTYPYAMGGVATWVHELIQTQKHLTFSIVALISRDAPAKLAYELPPNVISIQNLRL